MVTNRGIEVVIMISEIMVRMIIVIVKMIMKMIMKMRRRRRITTTTMITTNTGLFVLLCVSPFIRLSLKL